MKSLTVLVVFVLMVGCNGPDGTPHSDRIGETNNGSSRVNKVPRSDNKVNEERPRFYGSPHSDRIGETNND